MLVMDESEASAEYTYEDDDDCSDQKLLLEHFRGNSTRARESR